MDEDFSEANDLAAQNPEKLQALKDRFLVEATKYNVLPLDDSNVERFDVANRPSLTAGRTTFTYHEGMTRIPEGSAPDLKNRSWDLEAKVEIPKDGAQGLLFTQGGRFNGIGLYVLEGKPVFLYNYLDLQRTRVAGTENLSPGEHTITAQFKYAGGGAGKPADVFQGEIHCASSTVGERSQESAPITYRYEFPESTLTPVGRPAYSHRERSQPWSGNAPSREREIERI